MPSSPLRLALTPSTSVTDWPQLRPAVRELVPRRPPLEPQARHRPPRRDGALPAVPEQVPLRPLVHVRALRALPRAPLRCEPTARVEREYTRGTSQPRASRENIPREGRRLSGSADLTH
eukprot:2648955-Pyramimonas_sp.AAC.1